MRALNVARTSSDSINVAIALALAVVAASWAERHLWRAHHRSERAYLWLMSLDGGKATDLLYLANILYRRGDTEGAAALENAAVQLLADEPYDSPLSRQLMAAYAGKPLDDKSAVPGLTTCRPLTRPVQWPAVRSMGQMEEFF